MLELSAIVSTSEAVAATRSRKQKVDLLSGLLRRLEPTEVQAGVGFLCGELRQGKLGVGYRKLQQLAKSQAPAQVAEVMQQLGRQDAGDNWLGAGI